MTTATRESRAATIADLPSGGLPRGVVLNERSATEPFLSHFSEEPNIAKFIPQPVKANPGSEPLVWAIDDAHAPLYFFPRDCPRIAFWRLPTSTEDDTERLLGGVSAARIVIAVESSWIARIQNTTLYRYRLPSETFVSLEDYGAHVSRRTVTPTSVERVTDLLGALANRDVELRMTPSLWPLRRTLLGATLHYSMIRMRNATPDAEAA